MRYLAMVLFVVACTKASSSTEQKPASSNKLGAPIAANATAVSLATVMKDPTAYKGKSIVTSGTVTAVCQQMGCWMELKDDATEAHVKMAGEKFFVPKTSAGHKARVQATLVDITGGEGAECAHEAAAQTGKQVAKVELEATGVELD